MNRILSSLALAILSSTQIFAQQEPHYTQYMYNQSIVNPAYAGSKESFSLGLLYRSQWVGLEGAPNTATLFGHSSVGSNVGVGVSAMYDRLGPVQEANAHTDVSYTIDISGSHKLAFGVKGSISMMQNNLLDNVFNNVPDKGDPAFAYNESKVNFNVGAGTFFYSRNYYVGLSVPGFLKNTYLEKDGRKFGSDVMHGFFTAGYVFELDNMWKIKPSTMVKYAVSAPVSFDISANALWNEKLELGLSYRNEDSVSAMVNFAVMSNLRIGYAFDYILSDIKVSSRSSHEIILLLDIFPKRKVSSSPRYF